MVTYDKGHRALEVVMIGGHLALTAVLLASYVKAQPSAIELALAPLLVFPGAILADFFSAIVHFGADRFGSVQTPYLGRNVIRSFREHHDDPKAMTRHDFVTIAGDSCLLTVPVLGAVLAFVPRATVAGRAGTVFAIFTGLYVFMTSQIHKWSHMDSPPRVVQWLQRRRLLLAPELHAKHHTAPHDSAYATTTGWLNPILDAIGFFPRIERLLGRAPDAPVDETQRAQG